MKILTMTLLLTLSLHVENKIRKPKDRELVLSKPDEIKFITKPISSKTSAPKSSKIKLDNAHPRKTKRSHSHSPRKLYEKYDPKKYIRRFKAYQKHVSNAKHHILGDRKIALSKRLKDIRLKEKLHERMMHRESKKPDHFKVNMREFKRKHPHHVRRAARHLTKVVGDDAEEMNELHTNEDDDGGDKLESIPLLLVGDYEIIIEKK